MTIPKKEDGRVNYIESPIFAGPSKDGGKIFKANPRMAKNRANRLILGNVIIFMLCIVAIICGIFCCVSDMGQNMILNYIGQLIIIFSAAIMIVLAVTGVKSISDFNNKMSKIYIQIEHDRMKGLTLDREERFVYFDVAYTEIEKIKYNAKIIIIYLKNGKFVDYNVFYNPREIYTTIRNFANIDFEEE